MLETNKHPQSVLQHNLFGGEGVTTDEKDVFIQIKNSFAKLSHTCIHDCLYFISALKLALGHEEHVSSSFLTEFHNNYYYY